MDSTDAFTKNAPVLSRALMTPLLRMEFDNAVQAHQNMRDDLSAQEGLQQMRLQIKTHWARLYSSPDSFSEFMEVLDAFAIPFATLLVDEYCGSKLFDKLQLSNYLMILGDAEQRQKAATNLGVHVSALDELHERNVLFPVMELRMNSSYVEYRLRTAQTNVTQDLLHNGDRVAVRDIVAQDERAMKLLATYRKVFEEAQELIDSPMRRLLSEEQSSSWQSVRDYLFLTKRAAPDTKFWATRVEKKNV